MILVQKQKYKGGKKINGLLDVSGTKLANALGIKVYTPQIKCRNTNRLIINYGCSYIPWLGLNQQVINKPSAILNACNKIITFNILCANNIPVPNWTINSESAKLFFDIPKAIVFCRTLLSSSKGKGIVIARKPEELVEAPLYTLYIPKNEEYRFHIAFNKVIHIQKKLKLTTPELEERGITPTSHLIRNVSNGYIFTSNIDAHSDLYDAYFDPKFFMMTDHSIHAIQALGLDFGAVDLIVSKDGKVYILEVNTAPGIEGVTIEKYASAIQEEIF